MGLFRLAAVVAVGVSLLPAEREKQEQLYARAASAAGWAITFCDRNADVCAKAGEHWADFSKKAEFGFKLAYDVVRENQTASELTEAGKSGEATVHVAPAVAHAAYESGPATGTLTAQDMKPAWRGKVSNKAGI